MIRNALLSALTTLALAACGDGSSSASTAATASVNPNVGMIDRTESADDSTSAAPIVSTPAPTAPVTATTTPVKTLNGVATLDWQPPTQNSDGTTLTNLAGYTVYYGTSPANLSQSVKVSNPGLATYAVTGLTSGTWYFAIAAYSADGVESVRTSTVSTTI
jgi:hypothetical protein